ncbi:hypothetical protein SLA2020_272020 [Shorea laevis]
MLGLPVQQSLGTFGSLRPSPWTYGSPAAATMTFKQPTMTVMNFRGLHGGYQKCPWTSWWFPPRGQPS